LHTQPANPPLVALGSTWLLSVFLSPALFRQSVNRPVFQIRQHWRGFLLLGLIGGVTPIFGMTAFSLGNVAYVTTLFKLNTILTVLWSQW
jgi:NhaP-type Na+/H+ or K+/H+ antiporter